MNPEIKIKFPDTFTYCIFLFRLKLMDKAILPVFKGSMLRGLMGKALHRLNCQSRVPCTRCKMVKTCAYSNLFKPELVLKNQLTTPPFVLYSPSKKELFETGDEIEFTLILFGDFSRYFDYFLNAFNYARSIGLGQHRTPFDIEEITDKVSGDWIYKERDVNKNWKVSNANLSGFYGTVECCGDFTQLYQLLKAGEVLHIGARTSYGLGKYELTVL